MQPPHDRTSLPARRVLALLALLPAPAFAYRPFDATDAAVADKGELEVELGPLGYLRPPGANALVVPNLVLNWGFSEGWELVLQGEGLVPLARKPGEPAYAIDDTYLLFKAILRKGCLQGREGLSVATEFGALLPTVNAQPGAGAEVTFIVSQRWPAVTLHLNGEVAYTRAHVLGLFGGLIVEGPDAWEVRPVAELYLEGERFAPVVASGLAGAIWRAKDTLSFDAALRVARVGAGSVYEVRLGFTWDVRVEPAG